MIDGMSNQQALRGGALGGQARMALDAMAEYQVLTHNYAPSTAAVRRRGQLGVAQRDQRVQRARVHLLPGR